MCQVVVVRPGATSFDEQDRIKGSLDMPLSPGGVEQVHRVAAEMEHFPIRYVYCGPCESAQATASEIAEHVNAKWKVCECFRNIDHGLWEGKLIDEVRRQQPKLFRQVQENPRSFCPPGGETIDEAEVRVSKQVAKLCKKHRGETIAVVIPEPLATLVANRLKEVDFLDMWDSEQDDATWEMIDSETHVCVASTLPSLTDPRSASDGSLPKTN